MIKGISDSSKAMAFIRKYLRATEEADRLYVSLSMPLKLAVKRYDSQYRTKLIPDDEPLTLHDAYISKKEDLICVFSFVNDDVPEDIADVKHVEIPMKILGDRLKAKQFSQLMAEIGEAGEGELTNSDVYATPAEADDYDTVEEFGSWS